MEGALATGDQLAERDSVRGAVTNDPLSPSRRSSRGERAMGASPSSKVVLVHEIPGKVHRQPTLSDSTRAEFKAGKLSKVTFKYGFPQYAKPAAAASKQLGFKVGKEHETVVLTPGKDGKDEYKPAFFARAVPRDAPNEPELTTVPDRAQVIVNTAYLKQAAQNAMKYGWAKEKQVARGAKVYEVTRRHSWRRRRRRLRACEGTDA